MANQFCRNCGMSLEPDAAACRSCGTAVVQPAAYSQPAPAYGQPEPAYGQQAPAYAYGQMPPAAAEDSAPLSTGQFLLMMIISLIPMVGLVMQLVWAFGGATNINRRNYARAGLILSVIAIVLAIVFGGLAIALLAVLGDNYNRF